MSILLVFVLSQCAPSEATQYQLFGDGFSFDAQKTVNDMHVDSTAQVHVDKRVKTTLVKCPLYTNPCGDTTVATVLGGDGEISTRSYNSTFTKCAELKGKRRAGFVLVSVTDPYTNDTKWVSCPALLFADNNNQVRRVRKQGIYVDSTDEETWILVEVPECPTTE